MSRARAKSASGAMKPGTEEIFSHLEQAEEALIAQEQGWVDQVAGLEAALSSAHDTNRDLGRHLEDVTGRLEEQRVQTEQQRHRASLLTATIKDLHRTVFSGNLYEMILRASLSISGARRGLYITWRKTQETARVQAAVGIDGYPEAPPSEYVVALCRRVIELGDTIVCNDADAIDLPKPDREEEKFSNCAILPALLQRDFDGVVLVADKADGEFNEQDLEAMLSVGDQAVVAMENAQLQRELQEAYISTISTLADAVEAKDSYTHGHCELASRYARLTAERLGLEDRDRAVVCYAALLHDVGKIGVSDGVLNKPGPLLPEERELVKAHVRVGHDLLRHVPALSEVAYAVLHHHEWYDGSGYPDGLKGDTIPIAGRVVAVVDAFDAMISRRSYKEAYTRDYAREELRRFAGRQFDPQVVDAFLEILDGAGEDGLGAIDDSDNRNLPQFPHLKDVRAERARLRER